jgi:sugar phosphate isomerase/epimerase
MDQTKKTYPSLTKSYKGVYPFKLSTTSFIYPDDYIPNVKMLGSFFDEIELLLFESKDMESIFPKSVVNELKCLAKDLDIGYNVHLPTDISISAPDPHLQRDAIESYKKTIDLVLPLAPSTFFLHVPYDESDAQKATIEKWRDRTRSNLSRLLDSTISGSLIAIETLDYPLGFIEEIVRELNLSICMDVGHLILHDYDVMDIFKRYASKISSIHLHGVENNQDHLAIDRFSPQYIPPLVEIISRFQGILSLEVFAYQHLVPSLQTLERWWKDSKTPGI